jgi:anti-sigma regulatory factor (Ser/Thr protein kinase)
MADFRLAIKIANDLDQVWLVRASVRAILDEIDVADIDCLHVQLAISEAVNNCIKHSYQGGKGGEVDILIEGDQDNLQIEIADDGVPLRVEEMEKLLKRPVPEPGAVSELLPNGRGLQIIRDTMDSVAFARRNDRNIVRLCKVLRHQLADSDLGV